MPSIIPSIAMVGWTICRKSIRESVNLVRGDVRDAAFINRLVHGHEIVFHLAALIAIPYSYVASQSYVETNVLGTLNVLEAARQHGTERISAHVDQRGLRHRADDADR